MKRLFAPVVATIALVGCATTDTGEDTATTTGAGTATDTGASDAGATAQASPATAADYVQMAGASDLYEIQSSQAVLETTQNAELRNFAQMMIDHHTKTTESLTAAAKSAGMTPPPPQLDDRKTEMMQQLRSASGADRDRVYVQQQVMAHQEALALHSGYAQNGDNPALQAAASSAVPIVQQHLTEIQRISGQASS